MKPYSTFDNKRLMFTAAKAMKKVLLILDCFNDRGLYKGDSGFNIFIHEVASIAEKLENHTHETIQNEK